MDWTVLLSTALGGLLAFSGAFFGQRWNEKRAVEREARQRAWARQDANFHAARDACIAYYEHYESILDFASIAIDANAKGVGLEVLPGFGDDVVPLMARLYIYTSATMTTAASEAQHARDRMLEAVEQLDDADADTVKRCAEAFTDLLGCANDLQDAIRTELGMPPQDFEGLRKTPTPPVNIGDKHISELRAKEFQRQEDGDLDGGAPA